MKILRLGLTQHSKQAIESNVMSAELLMDSIFKAHGAAKANGYHSVANALESAAKGIPGELAQQTVTAIHFESEDDAEAD